MTPPVVAENKNDVPQRQTLRNKQLISAFTEVSALKHLRQERSPATSVPASSSAAHPERARTAAPPSGPGQLLHLLIKTKTVRIITRYPFELV